MESMYTVTLKEFIQSKDTNELTYNSFDIPDVSDDGEVFLSRNILYDYINDISERFLNLHLTQDEFNKYKFRPRLLAYRLYGNPNYYYMLLVMNNMCDEKQFDRNPIKILRQEDMINVISSIYNSNVELLRYHNDLLEKNKK